MILEDSVEVRTTPKRIFDFFEHMDENYQSWHPDHVLFRWVDGLGRSRSGRRTRRVMEMEATG